MTELSSSLPPAASNATSYMLMCHGSSFEDGMARNGLPHLLLHQHFTPTCMGGQARQSLVPDDGWEDVQRF